MIIKGDTFSALLEVLDGEQNKKFSRPLSGSTDGSVRGVIYHNGKQSADNTKTASGPYGSD